MRNLTERAQIAVIKSELLEMADVIHKDGGIDRVRIAAKILSICKMLHQMENNLIE